MGRPSCSTCLDSARGIVTMRRRLGCCLLISICGLAAGRVGGSAPPRRQPLANRFCDGRVQVRPWIFLASRLHLRGRVVQGVNARLAIRSPVARPCVTVGLLYFFSCCLLFSASLCEQISGLGRVQTEKSPRFPLFTWLPVQRPPSITNDRESSDGAARYSLPRPAIHCNLLHTRVASRLQTVAQPSQPGILPPAARFLIQLELLSQG